jgi:hypothetical protein
MGPTPNRLATEGFRGFAKGANMVRRIRALPSREA